MNKHLLIPGIFALCLSACGPVYVVHQDPPPPPPAATPPPAPEDVTYQTFYDQLSPYGQWVDNPEYGYVWMPDAGPDFKPYATNGHWVATDEGWAWDSGYPWGWATFHYGRWFFQDGYGWMWIPGNEWAPAWVSWRNSDDYYGWAPLGPNVSLTVAFGGGYTPPAHYWCFVPHQYVASPQVNNYYVRETNNVTIINRTTVINNYTVNNVTVNNNGRGNMRFRGGPDVNEINRYGGAPVRPVAIRESRNPGDQRASSSDFVLYRPRVNSAPAGNAQNSTPARPAPARYQNWNNQPARTSPGYSNNPNNQPNNQSGNNPSYTRPGAQPVNNTPANNPPVNTPPTYNRPTNNQPTYNRPTYNQPANNPPANNQPVNNPPANNQPANNPPANNRPSGNPAFIRPGSPNYGRPGSQPNQPAQQVNNPPANNQPANNQPANNPPAGRPQQLQMQQNQGRPGNGFVRPSSQPDNRPATNQPKPAVQQRVPPPPPKKDPPKPDNKQ